MISVCFMDGFWFVFCRLRVTAEPETIQPISNNSWDTVTTGGGRVANANCQLKATSCFLAPAN